jgi:competence protein ComEC
VMVLSHPHPDHFLGLESVIREVEVREFWDTGQGLLEGAGPAYARIHALLKERGVKVRGPSELCGRRSRFGVQLEVVAPCPGVRSDWSENDNSFVMRLVLGDRAFLFTGDAEHAAEAALLERGLTLSADFLKVGHHGSRTSSTAAFLDAVRPRFASLSTGVRNRFGHPHATTLAALGARAITPLRTDRVGGVRLQTDGRLLEVNTVTLGQYPTQP